MSYTVKIIIAIALGVVAAAVNMVVLSARTAPVNFIAVTRDVPKGTTLTRDDLEVLSLPGPVGEPLKQTAIGYDEMGVYLGRTADRDFMKGDILFFRDFHLRGAELDLRPGEAAQRLSLQGVSVPSQLLRIGCQLQFLLPVDSKGQESEAAWHGPFRLVSVGERMDNTLDASVSSSSMNTITVAVQTAPSTLAGKARQRALDAFAKLQQTKNTPVLSVRIIGAESS